MNCTAGELSMNSKCYRKYHERRTWFSASNECLSRNGSLAVFTDTGRPSDNNRLTEWLNASGADKTYWIGLVRSWWKTNGEGKLWHVKQLGIKCTLDPVDPIKVSERRNAKS